MPSPESVEAPKDRLKKLIKTLGGVIKALPKSLPSGTKDGPVAKNFTNLEFDTAEGPYYTFNQAWERVFQVAEDEKMKRFVRGKYGLPLVNTYLLHFSALAGIEANGGYHLMAERVASLIGSLEAL